MKHRVFHTCVLCAGLFLLAAGFYLLKTSGEPQGVMRTLPYVCIGVGCGLFGQGMGSWLSARAMRGHPELQRQLEIEQQDERNLAIANRAKGKAFDSMIFIFGALQLSFALMGVDLTAVLLLTFAYLVVLGIALYYRFQLEREM